MMLNKFHHLFKHTSKFNLGITLSYKSSTYTPVLLPETINPLVKATQYAVRGELLIKAEDFKKRLAQGDTSLPFKEIVHCNIGNPQELGQPPITFFRQVMALVEYPELLKEQQGQTRKLFYKEAYEKAKLLTSTFMSTGAYSHSMGLPVVRKYVAEFIKKRDGFESDPENIFLTDGASPAVQSLLRLLIRSPSDGIMIPTPQYPLYSASITLLNGAQVGYYLEEETGWSLSVKELQRSYKAAKDKGVLPRALVIINPGNPTGQCLEEENMKDIVRFCHKNQLVLLADEVYQENVYIKHQKPFISFKKIVSQMKSEVPGLELVSFHSTSKGIIGECGKRGGYAELHQINSDVKAELYKLSSINLCPNVLGQIMMFLMVNPPQPGDESWSEYEKEREEIFEGLKRRAKKLSDTLNSLEGITCSPPEGAMYAFPRIHLPKKAIEAAKKEKKLPDAFYCLRLLEETGICVVPGSGFGQVEGTWHFRTTFLPREDKIDLVTRGLKTFHNSFMAKYRD